MADNSEHQNTETPTRGRAAGRVKWFNNKAGYGFVTVTSEEWAGTDIFVHHSGLKVEDASQYKYLVQGEYVEFDWTHTNSGTHEWQAGSVRGINDGKLMCETRHEVRGSRPASARPNRDNAAEYPQAGRTNNIYRVRGAGPREGEEWLLVRRKRAGNWNGNSKRRNNDEDQS